MPLSDAGIDQARAAAQALSAIAIDRIYSSPLQRTRATAEAIADLQQPRPEITTDQRLTEVDAGPFEGMTEQELESGPLAADFARWHTDGNPEFPDGSEPFDAALARVGDSWTSMTASRAPRWWSPTARWHG